MAFAILGTPKPQFFGTDGNFLISGLLYTYDPATDLPKATYPTAADADAATNANTNPIVLNAMGEPPNGYFGVDGGSYKLTLKDASGAVRWSIPKIQDSAEFISVKVFGAVGDGSTDDTAAIQSAINYAESIVDGQTVGGASIGFPYGEYLVSSTLTVSKGMIEFRGVGRRSSTIFSASGNFDILDFDGGGSSLLSNGIINMSIAARGNCTAGALVRMYDTIEFYFDHTELKGFYVGLDMIGANRTMISDMKCSQNGRSAGTGSHVFQMTGDATALECGGNHFTDVEINNNSAISNPSYGNGWHVTSCDGLYITNCHINEAQHGMYFAPDDTSNNNRITSVLVSNTYFDSSTSNSIEMVGTASNGYQNIQFSNCLFREAGTDGVRFNPTSTISWLTFNGCIFRGHDESGLYALTTNVNNVAVSGCVFQNNNTDGGTSDGDIVVGGDHWTITGNVFVDGAAAGDCIRVRSGSNNTVISGNGMADSNMTTLLDDSGTDTVVANNSGYVTEANGTGTVTDAATTAVIVHGLSITPALGQISVIGGEDPANSVGTVWIDTITSTTFTVNVENDPGASGWDFGWKAN